MSASNWYHSFLDLSYNVEAFGFMISNVNFNDIISFDINLETTFLQFIVFKLYIFINHSLKDYIQSESSEDYNGIQCSTVIVLLLHSMGLGAL